MPVSRNVGLLAPPPDEHALWTPSRGAAIIGTGRSEFPNQVNNVLVFPGVFRGALDAGATKISEEMKIAAAHAIALYVKDPTPEKILPDPLDRGVAQVVAAAVAEMARKCGCVREE